MSKKTYSLEEAEYYFQEEYEAKNLEGMKNWFDHVCYINRKGGKR